MMQSKVLAAALCGLTGALVASGPARSADLKPVAPPPPIMSFFDTAKLSGYIDAGITGNADNPGDGRNFGQLFTDRANVPLLNQLSLTYQRPLDPKATGFDFGFKIQAAYGSDSRYIHSLGLLDRTINDFYQPDIVEAWGIVHLPYLTTGGIDLKVGKFVTPLGYETIDPTGNFFYTHGYIFNFGLPFNNTGALATAHITPIIDLYAGIDTGVNTTFVGPSNGRPGVGDNNNSAAFQTGFGLNLLDGKLTVLALTHIGPENPMNNRDVRFFNDVTTVYKPTDKLTFALDLNYVHDDINLTASGGRNGQDAYGAAGFVQYAFNDLIKINGRAEVFRDDSGFFVGQFYGNQDFAKFQLGIPTAIAPTGFTRTTYSEFSLGLNITPTVPKPLASITLRPEVRYDRALDGNSTPYGGSFVGGPGTKRDQFTFGGDIIVAF